MSPILIDFFQNLFNLILGLFVLRFIQMKLTAGPTDNALGWLLH